MAVLLLILLPSNEEPVACPPLAVVVLLVPAAPLEVSTVAVEAGFGPDVAGETGWACSPESIAADDTMFDGGKNEWIGGARRGLEWNPCMLIWTAMIKDAFTTRFYLRQLSRHPGKQINHCPFNKWQRGQKYSTIDARSQSKSLYTHLPFLRVILLATMRFPSWTVNFLAQALLSDALSTCRLDVV